MHAKLAGHLSLHDMISSVINDSREKVAAAEEKDEKKKDKKPPFMAKKDEKKNDHDADDKEKMSSVDFSNPDEVEKLAAALDLVGEKIAADSKYIGGESHQGGEVLATMSKVPGKQSYKKDKSKDHNVPEKTPEIVAVDDKSAKTLTEDNLKGGHIPVTQGYPKKGVMKTAGASVMERIKALKDADTAETEPGAVKEEEAPAEEPVTQEKKSEALDFILGKMAAFGAEEKKMGGETLDSAAEQGPKPASGSKGGNNVRSHISSNKAAIDMKKVEGKGPQKKMLSEVLTEPALSKAHDSKVQDNLRNAAKGGVKIAAAKAFLQKIAEEGCTCSGKGECKYCKMKKAMEKKSMGGMGMGGAAAPSAPAATSPTMPAMGR